MAAISNRRGRRFLTEAGLTPALAALARTAPLPVELHALPEERLPEAIERAAHIVVAAGIAAASDAGRSYVDVHLTRTAAPSSFW